MRTVTATAVGRAEGVPDLLTVQVGVSSEGGSAAAVMAESNRLTQQLLGRLAELGIAERDVATASVSLDPTHDRDARIIGYVAANMLDVRFRDLATAGEKLDALVGIGGDATRITALWLGFDDDDALLSAARADGIRRAKVQATEMAEAAGATVGEVLTISDVVVSDPQVRMYATMAAAPTSVPIAPGTRTLTVQVTVVYELA